MWELAQASEDEEAKTKSKDKGKGKAKAEDEDAMDVDLDPSAGEIFETGTERIRGGFDEAARGDVREVGGTREQSVRPGE
ncbi:hypothetical protein PM082_013065 [Marasmius tenuissimus]|nr:hypothetical protein PM082_013065 [Marasmius tenuissimus]